MLRRIKLLSFIDGGLFSLMVGLGETVAITFLAILKIPSVTLGLLSTLPPAFGAICQASLPFLFRNMPVHHLTLASVVVQILGLIGLGFAVLIEPFQTLLVGLCLTLYWIGGMTAGAPWQEWLARLIPAHEHNRFFAMRASFLAFVLLATYITVGLFMNNNLTTSWVAGCVFASAIFRTFSLVALFSHPQPPYAPLSKNVDSRTLQRSKFSFDTSLFESCASTGPKFSLLVLCGLNFFHKLAVCISGPFFAPYMLQTLAMTPLLYFSLNAVPLAVRAFFLGNWGRLLDEKRMYEGLVICVVGIAFLPALWVLNSSPGYITLWQGVSGLVWAGFELLTVLFIQQLYPNSIMRSLALFTAAGSLGNAAGGYIGGLLADFGYNYTQLFQISSAFRLISGLSFLWYLHHKAAFRVRSLKLIQGFGTVLAVNAPLRSVANRLAPLQNRVRRKKLVTQLKVETTVETQEPESVEKEEKVPASF